MKKRLLHLLYCFLAGSMVTIPTLAQTSPEDITALYLKSADFSSEEGWVQQLGDGETAVGGYGFNIDLQVAEAFAGNPNLDVTSYSLTQDVTLPAGDYRMTGYAFFRQGLTYDVAPAKSLAQMFAGDHAVTVSTLGSIGVTDTYANSMSMASNEFYENGNYLNTLDFSLDNEATLTVGYKGTFDLAQSWFICGEVRLYRMTAADYAVEYRDAYEKLEGITGLTSGLQSVASQTLERYAQVQETVDDYKIAIAGLKATLNIVEKGTERVAEVRTILSQCEDLLEQTTAATDTEKKQFDLTIATAKINLDEATTLENIEEIAATLGTALMQYAYNAGGATDITKLYIQNADYSTEEGWTQKVNITGWHPQYGFVDSWYEWNSFALTQKITLPAGGYRLTCNAFVQPVGADYTYPSTDACAQMMAGNDTVTLRMLPSADFIPGLSTGNWNGEEISAVLHDGDQRLHTLYFNLPEETTLPIGFRGEFSNANYYTVLGKLTLYTMNLDEYQEQYQEAYSVLQQYTSCPTSLQALINQTLTDYAIVEKTTESYNKAIVALKNTRRNVDTCMTLITEAEALTVQCEALLAQTQSAPEEEKTKLSKAIADAKAALEMGTTVENFSQLIVDLENAYTLFASATGTTQDVTQLYIQNADLSSTEGWIYNLAGRGFQPALKVAEMWYAQAPASYSLTQKVTLPAGGYRLTGYSFFGATDAEGTLARIIAGENVQTVIEADGNEFPNSSTALEGAAEAFYTENKYLNTLYFFLPQETTLELGYEGEFSRSESEIWTVMGAVRLYTLSLEEYQAQFQVLYGQLQEYASLTAGMNTLISPTLEKYEGFEGTSTTEYNQALAEMSKLKISVENFPDSIAEAQEWIVRSEKLLDSTPAESAIKNELDLAIAKAKINLEAATTLKAIGQIIADLQQATINFGMAADAPADITDFYIQNADLASRVGWTQSLGSSGYGFDTELRVAEAYNTLNSPYSLTQEITLPAGSYRLTGYAFFRQGQWHDINPEKSLAQLFAGEEEQTVATLGGINMEAYPNNMEATAHEFYDQNNYLNTLDFSLDTETTITIGYKGTSDVSFSWFICGEVRLYSMGLSAYQKEFQALYDELKQQAGQTTGLGNIIHPVLNQYNEMEETVTAYQEAIAALNGTKAQANRFITRLTEANELIAECESNSAHSTPDSDEAKNTFDQAIATAKTQTDQASTLEEIGTIMEALDNARQAYVQAALPEEGYPFDYTFLISPINEDSTEWLTSYGILTDAIQSRTTNVRIRIYDKDVVKAYENKGIEIPYSLGKCYYLASRLPVGHYKVAANMYNGITFFANEESVPASTIGDTGTIACLEDVILTPGNDLLIGFSESTAFKRITLEYKGVLTDEEHILYEQERLRTEIDEATVWSQTNVGEDAFQIPESAAAALKTVIQVVTPSVEATDLIAIQAARETLADALETFRNSELNVPEEGELFNIIYYGENLNYVGNPLVHLYPDAFLYIYASDRYAQTFSPEPTERPNCYNLPVYMENDKRYMPFGLNTPLEGEFYQIIPTNVDKEYNILQFRDNQAKQYLGSDDSWEKKQPARFHIVPARKATIDLDITSAGWATLMLPFDAEVPEGVTAYACSGTEDGQEEGTTIVTLEPVETLEANTPYILSGPQGTYSFSGYSTAGRDQYSTEHMTGTYVDILALVGTYVLQNQDGNVGFYRVTANEWPVVGANRAYMNEALAEAGVNVLALRLPDDGISTGIGNTDTDEDAPVNVYDLNGRLVRQQVQMSKALQGLRKGIYIVNGAKKAVK